MNSSICLLRSGMGDQSGLVFIRSGNHNCWQNWIWQMPKLVNQKVMNLWRQKQKKVFEPRLDNFLENVFVAVIAFWSNVASDANTIRKPKPMRNSHCSSNPMRPAVDWTARRCNCSFAGRVSWRPTTAISRISGRLCVCCVAPHVHVVSGASVGVTRSSASGAVWWVGLGKGDAFKLCGSWIWHFRI